MLELGVGRRPSSKRDLEAVLDPGGEVASGENAPRLLVREGVDADEIFFAPPSPP